MTNEWLQWYTCKAAFEADGWKVRTATHCNLTNMERYRSGHNEAVLKTVCPQGRVGSNPTPCAFFCLKADVQKKIKKFLTNEKHFDRIIKLSQDRELKTEFKKTKKFLTNEQRFDRIIKLSQESKTKNIDN